jgi:hypothetical protein
VVLQGTGEENSNVKGVRTRTSFASEAEFEGWMAESDNGDIVVARGVSDEVAGNLCRETPLSSLLDCAIHESTYQDGSVDPELLQIKLNNLAFVLFSQNSDLE